jgi:hypothetical protein
LSFESTCIQFGTLSTGKNTPARKIIGKTSICMNSWNPCCVGANDAIRIPIPDRTLARHRLGDPPRLRPPHPRPHPRAVVAG